MSVWLKSESVNPYLSTLSNCGAFNFQAPYLRIISFYIFHCHYRFMRTKRNMSVSVRFPSFLLESSHIVPPSLSITLCLSLFLTHTNQNLHFFNPSPCVTHIISFSSCFSYLPSPSTPSPSSWLPPTSQLASCEISQWVNSEACIPGLVDRSMFARTASQPASSWVQGTAATSVARA